METIVKLVVKWLSVLFLVISMLIAIFYRFLHADRTSTQIIIDIWYIYPMWVIGMFGVYYGVSENKK